MFDDYFLNALKYPINLYGESLRQRRHTRKATTTGQRKQKKNE